MIVRMRARNAVLPCIAALLVACSSTATISSPNPGTKFELQDKKLELPASTKIGGTTFGSYEFRAIESNEPSAPPFYGILPLALKKGRLAAGIILTAPVMLLTKLRGAFKFYEIDARKRTVRYRDAADGPWIEYQVTPEEEANARAWFEEQDESAQEESADAP